MIKIVELGSWDSMDMQPAMLLKVGSDGRIGPADLRSALIKRAMSNVFANMLGQVKLGSGDLPIHLIALGSTEGYGCFVKGTEVRRADGALVPIEQLLLGEDVVDRNGRVGKISTTYHQPFNGDGVRLKIAGLLDPITCTGNHGFYVLPASQVACKIDASKHCKPGTSRNNTICDKRNCSRAFPSYEICEKSATDLQLGDYMLCPVPDRGVGSQTWPWSEAFAAVFGYWLAEGSFIKSKSKRKHRKGLSFAFGLHEMETVCQDFEVAARFLCDEYTGLRLRGPYFSEENGTATYTLRGNDALAERVYQAGGEYSQHKKLGGAVYSQTPARLARMVASYLDGDGTCPKHTRKDSGYVEARYSATSASRRLALDMQWVLSRLGVAACVQLVTFNDNKTSEMRTHYRVSFNNASGSWLLQHCRKHTDVSPRQYKEHSFLWNGFICRPVRSVEHFRLAETVYNLEVLPAHSYTVGNGVAVKNCNRNGDGFKEATCRSQLHTFTEQARFYRNHRNKNPDKSYGKVALAAYNDNMRRIELLLVGNGTKEAAVRNGGLVLPDSTIDKFHAGDDIPFSMATKVAYDICDNCHNKAANRSEYCTEDTCVSPRDHFRGLGCQHGLGKLASNGRQQFVENPNCQFFDMSEVVKPADRTAYGSRADYMSKAAAVLGVMGGAELAEWWATQNGYEIQIGDGPPVLKLAQQLAAIEREFEDSPLTERDRALVRAVSPAKQAQADLTPLGEPGTAKAATGLAVLAGQKVALSLPDFLRWISGETGEKLASLTDRVAPHVPGVFTRLAADPDLPRRARDNVFQPDTGTFAPRGQRTWALKLAGEASLSSPLVEERIQRSVFRKDSIPALVVAGSGYKTAGVAAGPGDDLAQQYALYKLAFLAAQPQGEQQLPLTLRLVVLSNYGS